MHSYVLSTIAFLGLVTATSRFFSTATEAEQRVAVPVQGLDADRAPTIQRALQALESEGEPPHVKLLSEVHVDVDAGMLALSIAPGQELRLKQIERSLNATGVRIKSDRFTIGAAELVFEGQAGDDAADKLQRALAPALYAKAEVKQAEDAPRYLAQVVPGDDPATLDSVAKAARTVAPSLRVSDVVWTRKAER